MIEIEGLSYRYPSTARLALENIDLHLQAGQQVLLSGLSGSGKSTLLRAMNGLVPRFHGGEFAGRVRVDGLDTRQTSIERMASRVGLMFQEPSRRFISRSVVDEIAFGLEAAGMSGASIKDRVDEIVDQFNLSGLLDRQVDRLSGGEQQRVALAAVLSRRPRYLLLDEPTSQLDAGASQALIEWTRNLTAEDGLTLIVAEHRLRRWLEWVNSLIYLNPDGHLGGYGKPREVLAGTPYRDPVDVARERLKLKPEIAADPEALRSILKQTHRDEPPQHTAPGSKRLEAQELEFAYNGIPALRSAGMDLYDGQIVALMGPNGSGKSTLLRCLMGLNRVHNGSIMLDGHSILGEDVSKIAQSIAYVPQWPSALLFADSLIDELWWTLHNHHLTQAPPVDPAELLRELDLEAVADQYPRDLSAGQIQRAALAAVMVTKPQVLLLDEPTLGMDPMIQQRLGRLLDKWRGQGRAILIATHDAEFAAAFADRVVILEAGRVVDDGRAAETLFAHPDLRTVLQRFCGQAYPASPLAVGGEEGALE